MRGMRGEVGAKGGCIEVWFCGARMGCVHSPSSFHRFISHLPSMGHATRWRVVGRCVSRADTDGAKQAPDDIKLLRNWDVFTEFEPEVFNFANSESRPKL